MPAISTLLPLLRATACAAALCAVQTTLAQSAFNPSLIERSYSTTALELNLAGIHARGILGQGIVVAVLDTGLNLSNPEFAGNPRVLPGWNVNGSGDISDYDGHGTHVAGIIGAPANGLGMYGVAPAATLLPVKIFNSISASGTEINRGLSYAAAAGARIINTSLGSTSPTGDSVLRSITLLDKVLVVAAAGNRGLNNPDWPARYAKEDWAKGRILAVGAVDANRNLAPFSNRAGDTADFYLVAPGVNIVSTYGSNYSYLSGTSMAAPAVSGAAALLLGYWPYLRASQVAAILLNTADDLGAPGVDPVYGHGMLNVNRALSPVGSFTYRAANGRSVTIPLSTRPVGSSPLRVASPTVFRSLTTQVFDQYGRNFTSDEGGALSARSVTTVDMLLGRPDAALDTAERMLSDGSRLVTLAARRLEAGNGDPRGAGAGATSPDSPISQLIGTDWNHAPPTNGSLIHLQQPGGLNWAGGNGGYAAMALGLMDSAWSADLAGIEGVITHPILGFAPQHRFAAVSAPLFGYWRARMGMIQSKTISRQNDGPKADVSLTELSYTRATFALNVSIANMDERGLLGAYSHPGLGLAQNTSTHATCFSGAWKLGDNWTLAGQYSVATTGAPQAAGMLDGGTTIRSNGYGLGLLKSDTWHPGDRLSFSVNAPLRATSGTLVYEVVDQVTEDGTPLYRTQLIDLKGNARELTAEARYTLRWSHAVWLSLAAALRQHPDHDASAPAERLLGMRLGLSF